MIDRAIMDYNATMASSWCCAVSHLYEHPISHVLASGLILMGTYCPT